MRKIILSVVLAVATMAYAGCSSNGEGGGGDEAKAMSFNGDTSVPATGGAAIAVDYGAGFGAVISSMLSGLVADPDAASSAVSPKTDIPAVVDLPLPLCPGSDEGTALLTGELKNTGSAILTLTDCAGSPLGSVVNGTLSLTDMENVPTVEEVLAGQPLRVSATGQLAGRGEDYTTFAIAPYTTLTGGFAVDVEMSVDIAEFEVTAIDRLSLGERSTTDMITVREFIPGSGEPPTEPISEDDTFGGTITILELSCFEVSMSLGVDPPSIDSFSAEGVLSLGGRVYTFNSNALMFGGAAVPSSGSLELTSGGVCASSVTGDGSEAAATFTGGGNVLIDTVGSNGQCYECTATWENLLQTLSATVWPRCPSVSCGGSGGSGGSGTGGSGGTAGGQYCASYTLFSTDCFPSPQFRRVVTLDIEGSTITYTMTVGGLPATPPPTFPTQYDFDVDAAGTLSGMTATGTGEFVSGTATQDPACNAPEARLSFDIDFDDGTLATYNGTINFDFTLDANCGSSICFASASVTGGPCN